MFSFFLLQAGSSFNALMTSVKQKMLTKSKDVITWNDQNLNLVPGQRGKQQLVLNGYTFAINHVAASATYWCCRHRTVNRSPCRARARTLPQDNGLFTVIISKPDHNHQPPVLKAIKRQSRFIVDDS